MDRLDDLVRSTPLLDHPTLMAVDGVDGSGRTTFAAQLADGYARQGRVAHVVHLDDFLNPRALRYRLGRDSADGFFQDTYDLATFTANIIEPLRRPGGPSMVCRAFDYRADRPILEDPILVSLAAVVIVEGCSCTVTNCSTSGTCPCSWTCPSPSAFGGWPNATGQA